MNLDLFVERGSASPAEYGVAIQRWSAEAEQAGRLQRDSSADVYEHMWLPLTVWAIERGIRLVDISAVDLGNYLASRGGAEDLSNRYTLRVLRLVEAVLASHARYEGLPPNAAVAELLETRPEIRYSNARGTEPLPEYLAVSEAKHLVTFLSAVRPNKSTGVQPWQEVRNRASVALMLGAGITPGEVRALELTNVIVDGGKTKAVPWKLRVPGNGKSPMREAPLAPWAGQLLRFWLDVRKEQGIAGSMLFPSTRGTGKPWGKVAQYKSAREVLQAAGIDHVEGGSFRLRHTFALRQLRRGKTPHAVAQWLGVSPSVMERYARVLTSPVDVI